MKKLSVLPLALVALSVVPAVASAARYAKQGANGRSHVAHTRLAPVLMHRMFPPYAGVHVYDRSGGEDKSEPASKTEGNYKARTESNSKARMQPNNDSSRNGSSRRSR